MASIPGTEVEVKSGDVSNLTSPGLDELKHLINEATARHAQLSAELETRTKALGRASARLRWAQFLVIRLFTEKAVPHLVEAANLASDAVDDTRSHLDGCFVEVDFPFDDPTRASYAALIDAFEGLRTADRIWDITATAAIDRVTQRTTAINAITRVPVRFDFAPAEIIRSQYRAMRLGNVGGRDLQIYPGFIMMREASRDFALIEYSHLDCQLAHSNFIEEESVPADAEQVGTTWKRANKDGSRDRRFNDNYQIPVLHYGALAFSSPTGLTEVYQISSFAKASAFAQAIAAHKHALSNLDTPTDLPALAAPTAPDEETAAGEDGAEPAFVAKPRDHLWIDAILLALLIAGVGLGIRWAGRDGPDHAPVSQAAAPPASAAVPPEQPLAAVAPAKSPPATTGRSHHKHHRRVRHSA